jgi:hypothetical protein
MPSKIMASHFQEIQHQTERMQVVEATWHMNDTILVLSSFVSCLLGLLMKLNAQRTLSMKKPGNGESTIISAFASVVP